MSKAIFIFLTACLTVGEALAQTSATGKATPATVAPLVVVDASKPPLIPMPQEITWAGGVVELTGVFLSVSSTDKSGEQVRWMVEDAKAHLRSLGVNVPAGKGYDISVELAKEGTELAAKSPEAYTLTSTKEGTKIVANSVAGLFYGLQTLRQMIVRQNGKTTLALATIRDWPSVKLRGFMQDYGRNYLPMKDILEVVDVIARYKFNIFHFHCTDNDGWRLESKLHPQVNDPKSFSRKPGKFYTQQEFKALLAYCAVRNITVIPELDMPGHTASFRKAFGITSMDSPEATKILTDLIKEMAALSTPEAMPYIHIGTDEAHGKEEKISASTLKAYFDAVKSTGRRAIRWQQGMGVPGDTDTIQHLWANFNRNKPAKGAEYIDSQDNYLNHIDPFEVPVNYFFRKPGGGNATDKMIAAFLCSWPDLYIENTRDHIAKNPIYPAIVSFSEATWRNPHDKSRVEFYSNLPVQGDPALAEFAEFESRLIAHRDLYFRGKEFPYVKQTDMVWKVLGPIPHGGNTQLKTPVDEGKIRPSYTIDGKEYAWSAQDYTGGTLIFKHYCDYPTYFNGQKFAAPHKDSIFYAHTYIYSPVAQNVTFWISGHTWATSDWREGQPSVPGKWFHADTEFRLNGKLVAPPQWQVPNRKVGDKAIPMTDENYIGRAPMSLPLQKGWNSVLVKAPNNNKTRRWMFTFAPVYQYGKGLNIGIKEFPGLRFSTTPSK